MQFLSLTALVCVSLLQLVTSRAGVARSSGAFVLSPCSTNTLDLYARSVTPVAETRNAGIGTRKVARFFQVQSSHGAVTTFLEQSSTALYETFSQGSHASPGECLAATAAYVFPLMDAVENFGEAVKPHIPEMARDALDQIRQLSQFYSSVPFLSYTMSTFMYSGLVKKNQFDFSYFVRYNFLQSMILSSFQNTLAMFYFKLLPLDPSSQDFLPVVSLMSAVFASFGAVFYCVGNALFGRFASLPIISEAVQLHIGEIPSNAVLKKRDEEDKERANVV